MSAEAHAHSEEQPKPAHAGEAPKPANKELAKPAPATATPDKPHQTPANGANKPHATPATGERPIVSAYKSVKNGLTNSASQVVATTSAFGGWLRKIFRAGELEPVEEVNIPKTVAYAGGHVIDGTVMGVPRTAIELGEPIAAATLATGRTLAIPFSPLHSLAHPIEALKKPSRIVTSIALGVKNAAMAIPRRIHEFTDRAVVRTAEQLGTKLKKFPLIGSIVTSVRDAIGSIPIIGKIIAHPLETVNNIVGSVKNGIDWITSPIDHIHNATALGGAATPAAAHAH